jgi:precorrin-6B methylase 2
MNKEEYCTLNVNRKINKEEVALLKEYAAKVPENGLIVDIGTCEGGSAFAMAIGSLPSVKIITIDPTPNPRFEGHREKLGFIDKIEIIKKTSMDAWNGWDLQVDMFFHDGLHSFNGVHDDNETFCKWVKKDGLCLFHDYKLYNNSVGKAIDEGNGKWYEKIKVVDNIYIAKCI